MFKCSVVSVSWVFAVYIVVAALAGFVPGLVIGYILGKKDRKS